MTVLRLVFAIVMPISEALRRKILDIFNTSANELPFKVMNWNLLADGVSLDGFVVPITGVATNKVPKRRVNEWDKVKDSRFVTFALMAELPSSGESVDEAMEDGSIAEFIEDQLKLRRFVVDPIGNALRRKFGATCYDKNIHYAAVAACAQQSLNKFPIYAGHLVKNAAGVQLSDGPYSPSERFIAPERVKINGDDSCGKFIKDKHVLEKCAGNVSAEKAAASIKKATMLYLWAVERLNRKWGLRMHNANLENLLEWGSSADQEEATDYKAPISGRGAKLVAKIKGQDADIIGLEELDHYRFMQRQLAPAFSSTLGKRATHYSYKMDCVEATTDTTFAFHPKCKSNAARFHPKKKSGQTGNDNDGSAIFWKVSRYDALEIRKITYISRGPPGVAGGLVCVLLKDKLAHAAGQERFVWALATHLNSGDTDRNEEERIQKIEQIGPVIRDIAATTHCESEECKIGVVLTMDGNTYPGFTMGRYNVDNNVYSKVRAFGLTNFAVEEADSGNFAQTAMAITTSVNKIRGASSRQPWKIGEYQLDRIDYVAFSANLEQRSFPNLERYDRANSTDQARAFNDILPSSDNPSDHSPVVVMLAFKS